MSNRESCVIPSWVFLVLILPASAFYRSLGRDRTRLSGTLRPAIEREPAEEESLGHQRFWRVRYLDRHDRLPVPVPRPLRAETAHAYFEVRDIERLLRRDPDGLEREIAVAALVGPLRDWPKGAVPSLLADRGDPALLTTFRKLLEIAVPPRLPYPATDLPTILEAMLRLGDPGAAPLLRMIVDRAEGWKDPRGQRYREVLPFAQEALAFFEGDVRDPAPLLASERREVRLAAARVLSHRGDLRALPVLLDAVIADPAGAHRRLRPWILRLGEAAFPVLARRRESVTELPARVALDALRARIEDPHRAGFVEGVVAASVPISASARGPRMMDYVAGANGTARYVEARDRACLEEIVLFGDRSGARRVALLALALLRDEASLPVVVHVGRSDRELAAAALELFGPAGIEAAKQVPAPDPVKPAFSQRGSRHAAAAEALVRAGEPVAAEKIVAILTAPEPEEYHAMQAARRQTVEHLRLAVATRDERLAGPVIRLLETTRWTDVRNAAFDVVGVYEDERIVPLCLPYVHANEHALRAFVRRLGKDAGPFLLARFHEAEDEAAKLRLARALGRLRRVGGDMTRRGYEPEDWERRREAVLGSDVLAMKALGRLLENGSPDTQRAVAEELATLYLFQKKKTAPLEMLLPWVRTQAEPPESVVFRLCEAELPGAAEALLDSYMAGGHDVTSVVVALGRLRHEPAYEALCRGLERRLAEARPARHAAPEIAALAKLGEKGRARIRALLASDADPAWRVDAAMNLGEEKDARAFEAAEAFLRELLAAGLSAHDGTAERQHTRRRESGQVHFVTHALARMDPARAHRVLSLLLVTEAESEFHETILSVLGDLRFNHSGLRPAPAVLK